MDGRIAKYRKFLDNPISHNLELSGLWDHILLRANHSVSSFYLGQTKLTVNPGEFIWSQKKMADRFGISLNKTHRYLKILENEKFIETKGHSKYTVFKVLNRNLYQGDRKQIENKQKTNRKQIETYKNDNNVKNNNNTPEKSGVTKNKYSNEFENFWKKYPHARKGKKKDSYKYFKDLNVDEVMQEVNILNWKVNLGLENGKYIPACERWIRDFTITSENIKQQDIENIVNKLMEMEKGDKRKEYSKQLNNDFGKEKINQLVKKRNQNKNGITLNFK